MRRDGDTRTTPLRIDADRAAGTVAHRVGRRPRDGLRLGAAALAVPVRLLPRRGRDARLAGHDPTLTAEQTRLVDIAPRRQLRASSRTGATATPPGYHTFMLLRERCPCDACTRDAASRHEHTRRPARPPPGRRSPLAWRGSMIIATTPYIAGYRVAETKGQVFGLVVRSRGLGGNLIAGPALASWAARSTSTRACSRTPAARRSTGWSRTRRWSGAQRRRSRCASTAPSWPATMSEIVAYGTAVVLVPDASAPPPTVPPPAPGVAARGVAAMGVTLARGLVGGIGVLLIVARSASRRSRDRAASLFSALFLFVPGVLMVAAVILERTRYRSLHAEQTGDGHGPGGGEPHPPEPRFRPTDERFVDPTTGVPMQVWIDPATGERRYVPWARPLGPGGILVCPRSEREAARSRLLRRISGNAS